MTTTGKSKIPLILIIVGTTFLVAFMVLRIILPVLIKNIAERKLQEQLGVKTTIGDVSLSLLKGDLSFHQITLDNAHGTTPHPLLTLRNVSIDVALGSLLSNEIEVELIDIDHLELLVQRNKDGMYNYTPILERIKAPSPSVQTPFPSPTPGEKPAKVTLSKGILVTLFKANAVHIIFEDYAVSPSPLQTELKDISLVLKSLRYPDTTPDTRSEITMEGQMVATKTSPFHIHSFFQMGMNPPNTIISDSSQNIDEIYTAHFNPYIKKYGYIFSTGSVSLNYTGTTKQGQIDGLAHVRFDKVQIQDTGSKLSALILGIPLRALPQLFQYPDGTLELALEIHGDVNNPRVSWGKLSEQLLTKSLGNVFQSGSALLKKPFDLLEDITKGTMEETVINKLKDILIPQQRQPDENKAEGIQKDTEIDKLKDFLRSKLKDPFNKPKKDKR